ncbi:MAG: TRAP transporter small permease [Betaproteobacteria bacterium]|nr:TRAP transporter small permease [Betaproteobacteria bacterium]
MTDNRVLPALKKWRVKFFTGMEAVLFVLVLALLVLIALQVFTRYVMQAALPWTEEVARMVLVWTVMLGAAIAMERNEHYAITVLSDRFRGATRIWVLVITNLLGMVFLVALAYQGAQYMSANMKTTYVSTQVSRGWVYLALPVGSVIMFASLVLHSIEVWSGGDDAPAAAHVPPVLDV